MKRPKRSNVFFYVFLVTTFALSACSSSKNVNQVFEKKYGKEIEKIKVDRTPSEELTKQVMFSQPPLQNEMQEYSDSTGYYAYVDVSKFDEKTTPRNYSPNGETYQQASSNNPTNILPKNMFEIAYDTRLYPPFRRAGIEFDQILVPAADVYGIKTEMSEKPYLLVGNKSLQKNIDQINQEKTIEDIEISKILIKEQQQLKRRQRMIEIFGQDEFRLVSFSEPLFESSDKKSQENSNQKESNQKASSSNVLKNISNKASGFVRTAIEN